MKARAALTLMVLLASLAAAAGDAPPAGTSEVVVTAGIAPVSFQDAARSVTVLTREEIAAAPVDSVADLLAYAVGADVRPRGPRGVSADVALRGSTFEQVLVLLDGVKISDPQTGHHDLDLPLPLSEVERVEVLRGPAARLYGADAYAGVVNVITRRGREREVSGEARGGENGLCALEGGAAVPAGAWGHRLSASLLEHDGYRYNTAADLKAAAWRSSWEGAEASADLFAGWADKRFGANGFYSDRFPEAWERTETALVSASGRGALGPVRLEGWASWRRHDDTFLLDRTRPAFYRNQHRTEVGELSLRLFAPSKLGLTVLGLEGGRESIGSARLGDHARHRGGLYFEQRLSVGPRADLTVGASLYGVEGYGTRAWPGLDLGVALGRCWRVWLSVGEAFRVPSFTDLYYTSPTDRGNPDLVPEEAWTYEAGGRWTGARARAEFALFRREGREVIDFVRPAPVVPWTAQNLGEVRTEGLEASALLPLAGRFEGARLRASYAFLHSRSTLPAPFASKYALAYLRHQAVLEADHPWGDWGRQSWKARYESRVGYGAYWLIDARLAVPAGPVEVVLEGTNLLNTPWPGAGFAPMPGRWLTLGVRWEGR